MQNQRRPQQSQRRPQEMQPIRRPTQHQARPQNRPAQPTRPVNYRKKKNKPKKLWLIIGAVLLLLVILIASGGDNQEVTTQANNANVAPAQQTSKVFPLVAYDNNGVKITITGFNPNGIMGNEIEYTFENNSTIPIMLGVGDAYIDGWQISTLGGDTLPAGTKTNGTIYLSEENLEKCGITNITSLTLKECNIWNDEEFEKIDSFEVTINLT